MIAAFQFFHTSHCHLCDIAEAVISPVFETEGLLCEAIDIADHEEAMDLYADHIPVLHCPSLDQTLFWPFDASDVRRLTAQFRAHTGRVT